MADEAKTKFELSIEAMLPSITESVAAQLKQKCFDSLQYTVQHAVTQEVQKYIDANVLPSVRKELEAHEVEIRAVFVGALKQSLLVIAERVVENVTKRLAGYEGDELIRRVLGVMFGR